MRLERSGGAWNTRRKASHTHTWPGMTRRTTAADVGLSPGTSTSGRQSFCQSQHGGRPSMMLGEWEGITHVGVHMCALSPVPGHMATVTGGSRRACPHLGRRTHPTAATGRSTPPGAHAHGTRRAATTRTSTPASLRPVIQSPIHPLALRCIAIDVDPPISPSVRPSVHGTREAPGPPARLRLAMRQCPAGLHARHGHRTLPDHQSAR